MLIAATPDPKGASLSPSTTKLSLTLSRSSRGIVAALVLIAYIVSGVLHGVYDVDVTNPSGQMVISLVKGKTGQPDQGVIVEHHCHGCFSVSVPTPVGPIVVLKPARKMVATRSAELHVVDSGIDPPPPKFLT
ncbi:hypothetical protein [Afipia carboxidovorans]|jgi:hypothetical protein|uniref:hypothetical protein n=1 Tax=Afipia carboxidovorans TaxID=40137 RepID=UPI0002F4F7ED|nr:hypothetical protein [Afipia carboxidovorans]